MQHQSQSKDIPSRAVWKVTNTGRQSAITSKPLSFLPHTQIEQRKYEGAGSCAAGHPWAASLLTQRKKGRNQIYELTTHSVRQSIHILLYIPLCDSGHTGWFFQKREAILTSSWQSSKVKLTGVTCSHKKKLIGEFGKSAIITNILYAILIDINSLLIKRKLFLTMKNPF